MSRTQVIPTFNDDRNVLCAFFRYYSNDDSENFIQIVKQLWAYIRQNNLQDPDDKRKIICNDELRVVFGTDTTDMFKMNKLLAKHITPLDPSTGFYFFWSIYAYLYLHL